MIRAYVRDDTISFGTLVFIINERESELREVLRIVGGDDTSAPGFQWVPLPPGEITGPTVILPQDIARALLDGLSGHFAGVEDTRALRRDYDAERERVDRMIGFLGQVTHQLATPAVPAERTREAPFQ